MEIENLFGSVEARNPYKMNLDYYIISEDISEDFCDLKCYGVKITKTVSFSGGGKSVETKQINNIFYHREDVEEFVRIIMKNTVTPMHLRDVVEDYIIKSIDEAKKSA